MCIVYSKVRFHATFSARRSARNPGDGGRAKQPAEPGAAGREPPGAEEPPRAPQTGRHGAAGRAAPPSGTSEPRTHQHARRGRGSRGAASASRTAASERAQPRSSAARGGGSRARGGDGRARPRSERARRAAPRASEESRKRPDRGSRAGASLPRIARKPGEPEPAWARGERGGRARPRGGASASRAPHERALFSFDGNCDGNFLRAFTGALWACMGVLLVCYVSDSCCQRDGTTLSEVLHL